MLEALFSAQRELFFFSCSSEGLPSRQGPPGICKSSIYHFSTLPVAKGHSNLEQPLWNELQHTLKPSEPVIDFLKAST